VPTALTLKEEDQKILEAIRETLTSGGRTVVQGALRIKKRAKKRFMLLWLLASTLCIRVMSTGLEKALQA
jgi:hypothetical protein